MNELPIETAIRLVGLQPLAKQLRVTYQAIRKWCRTGVPPERVIAVCRAAGWIVTPHMVRPDIYPNPTDALPASGPVNAEADHLGPVECASGDPRRGLDRRKPDRREADRRKAAA